MIPPSTKGGGLAPHSPPAPLKAGGSAHGVGTEGLHGHSTSSSMEGPCPPAFLLCFSPSLCSHPQPNGLSRPWLLARVPTSGQAHRAGRTLKKGLLAQSSFRFADQRPPPPPGAAPLGSRSPEEQPFASLATSMFACLPGSVLETVTSLLGEGRGSQSPLCAGQGAKRSDAPGHQPPALLPGPLAHPQLFGCTIYLPLTQSRWWHLPANISDL